MDALREGVYLRAYAQKDPLIEYKTEAYDMFVELMANIKNEVLHNLFRSTSNLKAFEDFLASLPQFLQREHGPSTATATPDEPAERRGQMATARSVSIFPSGAPCRKSAVTSRVPAAAAKNTRTAAAERPSLAAGTPSFR